MAGPKLSTVAEIIDESPIARVQVLVFAVCILVSLFDGFVTQAISFVAPSIMHQWGISQLNFGFIFSGTLLGSVIGSSVFGALADRFGRKTLIILATATFAVFGAACAIATSFEQLLVFRIIGGIGMGGAIPNMLALTAEFAPARKRATIVTLTMWGFPAGAVLGGLASGFLISHFGWHGVFILGGIGPALLVPVMVFWLPESLQFLALDPNKRAAAAAILQRIAPERSTSFAIAGSKSRDASHSFLALFAPGLVSKTLLFSLALIFSLFVSYFLINWIPTLLASAGMSVSQAILGAVALNFGGIVGSYFMSRMIDGHAKPLWLLVGGFAVATFSIFIVSNVSGSVALVLGALTLCGVLLIGTQLSLSAFAAGQFPTAIRGSAIGFVQGMGRCGSLIGPLAGGALLSTGLSTHDLLQLACFPTAGAGLSLLLLSIIQGHRTLLSNSATAKKASA